MVSLGRLEQAFSPRTRRLEEPSAMIDLYFVEQKYMYIYI